MAKTYKLTVIIVADGEIQPEEIRYETDQDGQLVIYSKDQGVDIISASVIHEGEITEK